MAKCRATDCPCACHTAPTTTPPQYRRPDFSQVASPEVIAFRKREALAALEQVRQKRTTVEEP